MSESHDFLLFWLQSKLLRSFLGLWLPKAVSLDIGPYTCWQRKFLHALLEETFWNVKAFPLRLSFISIPLLSGSESIDLEIARGRDVETKTVTVRQARCLFALLRNFTTRSSWGLAEYGDVELQMGSVSYVLAISHHVVEQRSGVRRFNVDLKFISQTTLPPKPKRSKFEPIDWLRYPPPGV